MKIRSQKNFAAGLLYIAIGTAFAVGATNYNMGSADRMGPAYFPFWLGLLLALIGVVVPATSLRVHATVQALPHFDSSTLATRPLSLGLLVATALLIALAALPPISKTREAAFQERLITRGRSRSRPGRVGRRSAIRDNRDP